MKYEVALAVEGPRAGPSARLNPGALYDEDDPKGAGIINPCVIPSVQVTSGCQCPCLSMRPELSG